MMRYSSPLRYPGGKTVLTTFLGETLRLNGLYGGTYVEPFAGGAGAALQLLFSGLVSVIYINDKDPCIYQFWRGVVRHTSAFVELVRNTPISVKEWRRQKSILRSPLNHSELEVGFATFYINRCTHSGVLNGGPIGGIRQTGTYKIDARFNREGLTKRIERVGLFANRIHISNEDGIGFLRRLFGKQGIDNNHALVYMDPPYFKKGRRLYSFYFEDKDHQALAAFLRRNGDFRWILSCNDAAPIRRIYRDKLRSVRLKYCLHSARIGRELLIHSCNCRLPSQLRKFRPSRPIKWHSNLVGEIE